MKTIIMAGGRGTRISALYPSIPKPMVPINNMPVLEREIASLRAQGFTDLILTVSYRAEAIMNYFGDGFGVSPITGKPFGVNIQYFHEKTPLGNAGALFKLRPLLGHEPFLLINADVVFDVDFNRMVKYHKVKHQEANALVTLFTHPNSHPYDSGLIISRDNGAVMSWLSKEDERPAFYKNRVNAGLHIMDPVVLDMAISGQLGGHIVEGDRIGTIGEDGKIIRVDLDRQLLKPLASTGLMFCYDSPEYVKDMGTPERYERVVSDYAFGIVESKNLAYRQKAVFLDRDGTINKYVGFLRSMDEFELLPGVAKAIRKINASKYLCIVVTNQPVIARGDVTVEELEQIHCKMETLLGLEGAYIDGLYYCPHHPDRGYEGEVEELKIDCDCRKPKPGMLLRAGMDFNIDLNDSFMVGDSENDVKAGMSAGCRSVLISNIIDANQYSKADIIVNSLLEFVEKWL